MIHVAIMKKEYGYVEKLLRGEKTVESRWLKRRFAPWDSVNAGDTIYFKDSGGPVRAKASVRDVHQVGNLTPKRAFDLVVQYAADIGIENKVEFYSRVKDAGYCTLFFLDEAKSVRPFDIDKTGFGAQAAWLSAPKLSAIKA